MNRHGLWEELKEKFKNYPDQNQRTYPIHPRQYAQALTQQIARELGDTLQQLLDSQRFDDIVELSQQVRSFLREKVVSTGVDIELESPLHYIHYRYDAEPIPLFPGMYLTHPAFISNRAVGPEDYNLFKTLKFELLTADSVNFMVSFVKWSGLQLLWRSFLELERRQTPVRILTTNYLHITEPKALRKLTSLNNVKLKMFVAERESFHTKAYLFERNSGLNTVIIGSSNLSNSALRSGHEWNVKLPSASHISVYSSAGNQFEELWTNSHSQPVTDELLAIYEEKYHQERQYTRTADPSPLRSLVFREENCDEVAELELAYSAQSSAEANISPNEMQKSALAALKRTRMDGNTKGVVVAATGTGKTFLSAFDAQAFQAKSLLFLAHRDELLEGAKDTFVNVFGDVDMCGKFTGTERQWEKPFLFSTVQTMHREENLRLFQRDRFDYIVVDEFHHAQAETYRTVLDYFQPKFLLGLTATPERMDGREVLELCDYNLVYEIRLRDALAGGLLAPFHYFGLADPTVDYDDIEQRGGQFDEHALVRALRTHERVKYVIDMMETFGHDGDRRIALGFCATIEHAEFMAQEFNLRGYRSAVLTGRDSPNVRRDVIRRLEDPLDSLQIIFTVDVFNEGIDVPKVNLLLFLRPTESATIFLQQLGRGLRKAENKEYVTVLDFIGNYQKSFVVPLALSGQFNHRAFDKDSLRVAVETEFADLPEGCAVDLEPVSREQILKKIDEVRLDRNHMLMDLYREFRSLLGRPPEIEDFLYAENAPGLCFFISRYNSWVETKERMGDANERDRQLLNSSEHLHLVRRLEKMFPLKWPYEFVILQECVRSHDGLTTIDDVLGRLLKRFGHVVCKERHRPYVERAMLRLSETTSSQGVIFGAVEGDTFHLSHNIRVLWSEFEAYLNQRLEYGLIEFQRTYRPTEFFRNTASLILYQNYTRNELIFLFQANVQEGSWREGISKVRNHYLLFINLKKGEKMAEHLRYHDQFIDNQTFHWQSANQTSHESERGQDYVHHDERGIHIHLFIRKFEKMHGMTLPFMYLGEVNYVSSHGNRPMNITWKLSHPVPHDLFMDFIR
jgi:superfamily II DNA or RNA helicase